MNLTSKLRPELCVKDSGDLLRIFYFWDDNKDTCLITSSPYAVYTMEKASLYREQGNSFHYSIYESIMGNIDAEFIAIFRDRESKTKFLLSI